MRAVSLQQLMHGRTPDGYPTIPTPISLAFMFKFSGAIAACLCLSLVGTGLLMLMIRFLPVTMRRPPGEHLFAR